MGFAVEAMGTLNRFGEWIGSGFDMGAVNSANAGERAAIQQERARDKLYAENDPKQVAAIRESIRQFQRDDRFNSASPKEQQSMLRDEIASLATQEKKARAEKKIGEAEALKLERLKKEAELRKNIESFTAKQRENAEAIERASLARQDEEEEAERKKAEQLRSELDDIFAATERALATDGLARASSLASSQRNPFESSGVSGFGSASAAGAQFVQEGNRLLAEQLRALKRQEELLEDILARN